MKLNTKMNPFLSLLEASDYQDYDGRTRMMFFRIRILFYKLEAFERDLDERGQGGTYDER